jgi:hypothetical protein
MKEIKEYVTWGITALPPLKEISSWDLERGDTIWLDDRCEPMVHLVGSVWHASAI